jgi:hypothetical protein
MFGNQVCSRIESGFATKVRLNVEGDGLTAESSHPVEMKRRSLRSLAPPERDETLVLHWAWLLCFQVHRLQGQVPVGVEDFETLLLFAVVGFFVGEQLFLQCILVERFIG